ncbi:hypothetical protein BJV78DRAFT_236995 [Lactifluus subvellereus]|nr:hypothetical protein BJV78DRAFT_236995 [Lactifluus subvellereus]
MDIPYLMGWGDVYQSHTYSLIYWSAFVSEILQSFPNLPESASFNLVGVTEYAFRQVSPCSNSRVAFPWLRANPNEPTPETM